MDERKRIMDLVKKGVITSEEAIVLLEKLGQETAEGTSEDPFDTASEQKTNYQEQEDASSDYIANLKKRIEQVKERLTVLNTLDDFERLDDEEAAERDDLEASLSELKVELARAQSERESYEKARSSEKDSFFGFDSSEFEDEARNFAAKVKEGVKSFSNNFELHDFSIKIPGFARSKKIVTNYEYAPDAVHVLDLKNFNGNVIIRQSEDQQIHEQITYQVYGNIRNNSAEDFFENNTVNELKGATLTVKMHHRISATIELTFPVNFRLASARLRCKNGSFKLADLDIADLIIAATNGNISFQKFNVDHAEINNVNGSITVKDCWFKDGILSTVNGSIRTVNSRTDLEISNVNGNIILSKISPASTNLDVHLVNGDVKISIPPKLGYQIKADTKNGSINQRLSDVEILERDKRDKSVVLNHDGNGAARFQISTISGSVYLKDITVEGDN